MKTTLLIFASMACAAGVFAQGSVNSQNYSGIYGAFGWSAPITVNGSPATGTGYSVELFGGPAGTASSQLTACTNSDGSAWFASFRGGNYAGLYNGTDVYVQAVLPGQIATLQLRAWNNQLGTMTTWNSVYNVPGQWFGYDAPFPSAPLGGVNPVTMEFYPTPALNAGGTPGPVDIHSVPEPSTIALGVIGATAFLARRRNRKQQGRRI